MKTLDTPLPLGHSCELFFEVQRDVLKWLKIDFPPLFILVLEPVVFPSAPYRFLNSIGYLNRADDEPIYMRTQIF